MTTLPTQDAPKSGRSIAEAAEFIGDRSEGDRAPLSTRIANLVVILVPFIGLVAAFILLWPFGFSWVYLGLFLGTYLLTGFGITIGYHRYFTHKSFETGRVMTFIMGVLGSMAVEGSVLDWVAEHRKHHQHSDQESDPHSPHTHGAGFWNMLKGLWHSHMGWLASPMQGADHDRYVPDLKSDRLVAWLSRTFLVWALLGLAIPALIGGLVTMSWTGALLGFIWGGLVRVFFVHHVTWSVNSVCHLWGRQPFDCHDESRNNAIVGVLALGEGWHNNHHAFPTSARHGLAWWQIDTSYMVIRAMEMLGLAKNLKVPAPARIESKRRA